ncbi:MAG TPA: flagellar biosynthetic protein FliO [Spirochaetota bacterium]|nr:flagellar biosynthetic protein FliO [Spirochaetota bacterium]
MLFPLWSADQASLSNQQRVDSADQAAPYVDPDKAKDPQQWQAEGPGYFWLFVKTILVLALFMAVFYFLYRYSKKRTAPGRDKDSLIQSLYDYPLGVNKKISVMKVAEAYYLLGITQENISVLAEIKDKATIDLFKLEKGKAEQKGSAFANVLGNYINMSSGSPLNFTKKIRDKVKNLTKR